MEAEVLKEEDLAVLAGENGLLDVLSDAVVEEGDGAAEELAQFLRDGLERVLGAGGAVGATKVGHEDDRLGAVVKSVLDGGKGGDDTLE